MKDLADKATIDIFQPEKRLGRPVTGTAKTNAQRMREYRLRRKEQGARVVVQRPEQYQTYQDWESHLLEENDRLTLERDTALARCDELQRQLYRLIADMNKIA